MVDKFLYNLIAYYHLIKIRLKSQTAYSTSYLIEIFGHLLNMATHVAGIFCIFYHTKELKGWTTWEVVYLYGMTSFGFAIAQLTGEAFEDLYLSIKSGDFDRMLTKPVSPIIQMASLSFRIERLGGVIQSSAALMIAGYKTGVLFSLHHFMLIGISVISMSIVYYALFLASGTFSFWTLESSELFNAFTYGGVEVSKYPLSIYKEWMQSLFLFLIPIGFVSYLPAVEIFGKNQDLWITSPGGFFAPFVALFFLGAVWLFWRFSLKHYQSTGS